VRAAAAGIGAGAAPQLSTPVALPAAIVAALEGAGVRIAYEDEAAWEGRIAGLAARRGPQAGVRVRVVAQGSRATLVHRIAEVSAGKPDIAVYGGPVVSSGRVEMLPHLREQAVSITAHRFGTPNRLSEDLI